MSLRSADELLPQADLNYVLVRRETYPDKRVIALAAANLEEALKNPASEENIELSPRDILWAFDLTGNRNELINPLLEQLSLQAVPGEPYQAVISRGSLRDPGDFPYTAGMRVSNLVYASGGLLESSYLLEAEELLATRSLTIPTEYLKRGTINLQKAMEGDPEHDILFSAQRLFVSAASGRTGKISCRF